MCGPEHLDIAIMYAQGMWAKVAWLVKTTCTAPLPYLCDGVNDSNKIKRWDVLVY